MKINADNLSFKELNTAIRKAKDKCEIQNTIGQRFIAAGMSDITVTVNGVGGNALGAYLNGGKIIVNGNAGYRAGIHTKADKEKMSVIW